SRMLCQLSYRGTALGRAKVKRRLDEVRGRAPEPFQGFLQLFRVLQIGRLQLAAKLSLAQVEQQLLRRRLVDPLGVGAGVELRQELDEVAVGFPRLEQVCAPAAVQLDVEVIW